MARPRIEANPKQIEALASIGCTIDQIAIVTEISKQTLLRRFGTIIKKGRENGNISLQKKQFDIAMGGNVTMLIWLGKQRLGQKEIVDQLQHEVELKVKYE